MKKYIRFGAVTFLLNCISLLLSQKTEAQVSGIKTIPGDYGCITKAIQQLRVVGVSGPTFLELQAGHSSAGETVPTIIRSIPKSGFLISSVFMAKHKLIVLSAVTYIR